MSRVDDPAVAHKRLSHYIRRLAASSAGDELGRPLRLAIRALEEVPTQISQPLARGLARTVVFFELRAQLPAISDGTSLGPFIREFCRAIHSDRSAVRTAAEARLWCARFSRGIDPDLIQDFLSLSRVPMADIRAVAISSLGQRLDQKLCVNAVILSLSDADSVVRQIAARCLRKAPPTAEVVNTLRRAVHDSHRAVRTVAATSLIELLEVNTVNDERIVDLAHALNDNVRAAVLGALTTFGDPAEIWQVAGNSDRARLAVLKGLAASRRGRDQALHIVKAPDKYLRAAAVQVLGLASGGPDAPVVNAIFQSLHDL